MGRKSAVFAQFASLNPARRRAEGVSRTPRFRARVGNLAGWTRVESEARANLAAAAAQKASSARRFYAHGDQSEADPALFFCANSDQFKSFSHFMYEPATASMMRYAMDIKLWTRLAHRMEWRRPAEPENIIDPPGADSATAVLLTQFQQAQEHALNWLAALPAPDGPLDTPLELPPHDLTFPKFRRQADIEGDLNRLIREHGIKHLKVMNPRPRDEDENSAH